MSLTKYQVIIIILSLSAIALFTVVNYFSFYNPKYYFLFILVQICAITVSMFTIIIIFKLKSIIANEGYIIRSDQELYEIQSQKASTKGITNALNTKKYLNTTTMNDGITFDKVVQK